MIPLTRRSKWWLLVLAASWAAGCRTIPKTHEASSVAHGSARSRTHAASLVDEVRVDPEILRASAPARPTEANQITIHLDLARVLDQRGQLQEANAEYQRAVDAAQRVDLRSGTVEQRATTHRRLAAAYDRLGRFGQAREHYHQAQKLAPRDPNVWNDAGYSAYLQGQWEDAERDLRKALSLDRGHTHALVNLGLALAASGRTEEAFEMLRKAGGEAAAHANLGYVLAAQGNREQAREHYQQALMVQPNMPQARQALAALDGPIKQSPQLASSGSGLANGGIGRQN